MAVAPGLGLDLPRPKTVGARLLRFDVALLPLAGDEIIASHDQWLILHAGGDGFLQLLVLRVRGLQRGKPGHRSVQFQIAHDRPLPEIHIGEAGALEGAVAARPTVIWYSIWQRVRF